MCGRFVLQSAVEIISQIFRLGRVDTVLTPRYNIAPSQEIAIVTDEGGVRRLVACRWGFLPNWAKDPSEGHASINARAETVAEKPSFRQAFQRHRCLVVADGFYEWKHESGKKRPFYIHRKDGNPFGIAGLYNIRTAQAGEQVCTTTIITTDANDMVRPLHDRMPVIASPDHYDLWLDPGVQDKDRLLPLLKPCPSDILEMYEVAPRVNSPKNEGPENIARAAVGGQSSGNGEPRTENG
jgi:putative SOS response-associated peptidase YedK